MASVDVVMVAVPPEILVVPITVDPSLKTTVPVGLSPSTPVTSALNVTGSPDRAGFGADVTTTVAVAGVAASVTGVDWLASRRLSPE